MHLYNRIQRFLGCSEISQRKLRKLAKLFNSSFLPRRRLGDASSLSIVVPCYCHEEYLEKTFSSIINQTIKPDQVVFVDDCSPDRTSELLEELVCKSKEVNEISFKVVRNFTNVGQSETLNRAINEVFTDLVMVLNDDDYLMHDAVEVVKELFRDNDDLFLIGSHSIHFSTDEELAAGPRSIKGLIGGNGIMLARYYPRDVTGYKRYNDLNMTHSGSSFLKGAWQAVGGYRSDKRSRVVPFSDRDFQLRVNALFPVAVSLKVPFVYWRCNSSVDGKINS